MSTSSTSCPEASGLLVVAKSQNGVSTFRNTGEFCQRLVRHGGGAPCRRRRPPVAPRERRPYELEYRTMRATDRFTLLKFKSGYDVIRDMLPALRKQDCLLIGVGKTAPDPIKRGGIHLFALASKVPTARPST